MGAALYDALVPTETDLIAIIAAECSTPRPDVILGIGDDAAVVRAGPGDELVACTDTLVAGVHFPADTPAEAVGHKALAVNLSDLAAMAAEPRWALLALTLPEPDVAWVRGFATGFSELARRFAVNLVGGDTTAGPLTITVQALGVAPAGTTVRRAGARAGDALCVSGTLGDAALALAQWRSGGARDATLRARLERPEPRVALGRSLRGVASAAIDVSDGLLRDLDRLVSASGVGAELDIDALPRSSGFTAHGGTTEMQMTGGDDYELLFTVDPSAPVPDGCTRIGTIHARAGIRDRSGNALAPRGWEHFA